jgi:hypothetical protein
LKNKNKIPMNKIKIFSLAIITIFGLMITSCDNEPIDPAIDLSGDDTDGESGTNQSVKVFKADFSGSTWSTGNVNAVLTENTIKITAIKTNGDSFDLSINGNGIGTYNSLGNLYQFIPMNSQYSYSSVNALDVTENTGDVTITSINPINKTISGIFNFKGYWSEPGNTSILPILFSDGAFQNVPYTNE